MEFTGQEWALLSELMDQALELTGPELEDWLDHLPQSCPVPRSVMRDLLADEGNQELGRWWDRLPFSPQEIQGIASADRTLFAGKIVGAYRLIRELGQGGMGAVWLAERTDGILNRPVAIKLPHAGIYSRHFLERFRRERQILAGLTHPNIGRGHGRWRAFSRTGVRRRNGTPRLLRLKTTECPRAP
jgi:eukaryotic-like serine/threonine-protein kinase